MTRWFVLLLTAGLLTAQIPVPQKKGAGQKKSGPRKAGSPRPLRPLPASPLATRPAKPPKPPPGLAPLVQSGPLRVLVAPVPVSFALANGMKVYLLENRELPLVNITAMVRTGDVLDPADKVGLARLVATVLKAGEEKAGWEEFGASLEAATGPTHLSATVRCLGPGLEQTLELIRRTLVSPDLSPDRIATARTQLHAAVGARSDELSVAVNRELTEILFAGTPFFRRLEHEHLDRIQPEDVTGFHARYFFPANILVALEGDFSAAEMRPALERLFAGWNAQQTPVSFPELTPKPPAGGAFLAERGDGNESFFALGHMGGLLKDKDYAAMQVIIRVLGGKRGGRLVRQFRGDLRWTSPGSGAHWEGGYDLPGLFRISGATPPFPTTETIQGIVAALEKLRSTEVEDRELESAKSDVLYDFVFDVDRPGRLLDRLLLAAYHGYPADLFAQYQKAVHAVTKADVLRLAKEHLRPSELVVVVAGRSRAFGKELADLNLPVKALELASPLPVQPQAVSDAASLEKGRQLLQRVQKALGGAEKLAAVKDCDQLMKGTMLLSGGAVAASLRTRWSQPTFFRQDQDVPTGQVSAFFSGRIGWVRMTQGTFFMPPGMMDLAKGEVFRLLFRLTLSDADKDRTVNAVAEDILEISDKGGNLVRVHVDPQTALPLKFSYRNLSQAGVPVQVEETLEDYREVGGIRLPHRIAVRHDGRLTSQLTTEELKVNSGIRAAELGQAR